MKSKDLIELGFEEKNISSEESGAEPFTYYCYDKNNSCFLISSASDEFSNDEFYVEIFNESDLGKTFDKKIVEEYINVLNKFNKNENR